MTTFFKIKSNKTGLYSTGGQDPKWSSIGKVWPVRGHITSHFTGLTAHGRREYVEHDAQVVECVVQEVSSQSVALAMAEARDRKLARETARKARVADWNRKRDEEEFERLGKRLGKF